MTERSFALVLGAGGTVGMAFHAGALHALHQVGGVDGADADLVIGTSAGSVVGAYLRTGWTTADFWAMAMGTHPTQAELDPGELARRRQTIFTPAWASPAELARRGLGSAFVLARSLLRGPGPAVPRALRRRFPGGFFAMAEAEARFAEELGDAWPDRPLWLCAVDIGSGRRVVFGRHGAPDMPLSRAVLASCAIPGVYQPVRAAGMTLVDGGVRSTTNLDLAGHGDHPLVVCVAPMAYDPARPPGPVRQLARRGPARTLSREVAGARAEGAEVLLVRPTGRDVHIHGPNLMRPDAGEHVARAAYETTARLLETARFRDALERVRAR